MISDFLLHPAMNVNHHLKKICTQYDENFWGISTLGIEIKYFISFFGLKWGLIFLNEFVPDDFMRQDLPALKRFPKREGMPSSF